MRIFDRKKDFGRVAGLFHFIRFVHEVVNFFAKGWPGSGTMSEDGCKVLGGSLVICGYKLADELLLK